MNEAELLFTYVLNCNRLSLYADYDLRLNKAQSAFVASVLKRRFSGHPLQYILGKTEFMGLEFKLSADVFIPRPETEILVETVMNRSTKYQVPSTEINILDIGTGSGCIAVSLAKELSNVRITATDISDKALKVARENAALNNVEINFIQGDLFTPYAVRRTPYDIIISNPPYIRTLEIDDLPAEVQSEPRIALDGGRDGLSFYKRIIKEAWQYLKEDGLLILEMGFNQAQEIKNIFKNSEYFKVIEVIKDYNNIERVIVAKKAKTLNG